MGLLSHPADFSGLHSIPLSETGELLHLLQIFWLLHALDCSNLLGIAFDSPLGNEKSQELAGWDPENTLLRIELDLICSQVCKRLSEVVQECDSLDRLHHQIVHIHMKVSAELGMRASLDRTLICGTSILQTERHGDITISPEWGYECSLYLIFNNKFDLVIAGCGIQKRQQFTPGRRVDHLINTGKRILWACLVQASVIDTHAQSPVFFHHEYWFRQPLGVEHFHD